MLNALDAYRATVTQRRGTYVPLLPANTNLGPTVLNFPGARFPESGYTTGGWRYELAPLDVVAAVYPLGLLFYPLDKSPAAMTTTAQATAFVRDTGAAVRTGLGWSVETVAQSLGVSVPVLLGVAGLGVYLLLRSGVAPYRRR